MLLLHARRLSPERSLGAFQLAHLLKKVHDHTRQSKLVFNLEGFDPVVISWPCRPVVSIDLKPSLIIKNGNTTSASTLQQCPERLSHNNEACPKEHANLQAAAKTEPKDKTGRLVARDSYIVKTYVHIVTSTAAAARAITDETIKKQIKVLNDNYAATHAIFDLKGTTRSVNATWATDYDEEWMKRDLRQGNYADLNLYYLEELEDDNLGYCYYPVAHAKPGTDDFDLDGCAMRLDTLPGNKGAYGLGKTTTHEVGHWFGLAHTFEGRCTSPGDEVDDTPAQASESSGCPKGRDSCPTLGGPDSIHNHMDYSDDSCYEGFTVDQQARIRSMWYMFRAGK
ncbi:hypothetical protein VHEMI05927 [[Torrubiella] hemipterigena]|uniref:Peptidase M43 pregnancy-associated plasma-A domain-containing protein n=1 Tax=[Torrubiella] hemipterigena TaxID=1531966 RepID=A0A0A1TI71_9HYPO|nr:hypothetical protein VHEMI05927 [[Torrubiella] hemipterigena]